MPGLAAAGFSSYADDAFPQTAGLSRWLGRSRKQALDEGGPGSLSLFARAASQQLAGAAALSWRGDYGEQADGFCLRADPVHLRADARGLLLYDASTFPFSDEESRALSTAVAELLSGEGWRLRADRGRRWYLLGEQPPRLETTPLTAVRGGVVNGILPRGEDAVEWRRRLNEIQMLMHSHPVNRRREARNLPVVNSLWLWGEGEAPPLPGGAVRVHAGDPLLRGLAANAGLSCGAVPSSAGDLLSSPGVQDEHLVLLDACDAAAAYGDFQRWHDSVLDCERDWFGPLLAALGDGVLTGLDLVPGNGWHYRLRRRDLWRFWRSDRPCQRSWS